jgi:hypothetical protein
VPHSAIHLLSLATSKQESFTALLEGGNGAPNWVVTCALFDVVKTWPNRKRLRMRGEINGFAFSTSLFAVLGRQGHMAFLNKEMQTAACSASERYYPNFSRRRLTQHDAVGSPPAAVVPLFSSSRPRAGAICPQS